MKPIYLNDLLLVGSRASKAMEDHPELSEEVKKHIHLLRHTPNLIFITLAFLFRCFSDLYQWNKDNVLYYLAVFVIVHLFFRWQLVRYLNKEGL